MGSKGKGGLHYTLILFQWNDEGPVSYSTERSYCLALEILPLPFKGRALNQSHPLTRAANP